MTSHFLSFPPVEWHFCDIMLDITFLELVPILLAIFLFKNNLVNKQIKSKRVMQLIRSLVLKTMLFNLQGKSSHIEGRSNCVADAISRKQWARFGSLVPDADFVSNPDIPSISEADLGTELGRLVEASLATNTKETYKTGLSAFARFRHEYSLVLS